MLEILEQWSKCNSRYWILDSGYLTRDHPLAGRDACPTGICIRNSNSDFWGSVYAPRAHVNYNSESDFYGSVSGKYVDICSQATIHYDEALGNLKIKTGSPGDTFVVKSWHELVPAVGS